MTVLKKLHRILSWNNPKHRMVFGKMMSCIIPYDVKNADRFIRVFVIHIMAMANSAREDR